MNRDNYGDRYGWTEADLLFGETNDTSARCERCETRRKGTDDFLCGECRSEVMAQWPHLYAE